MDSIPRQVVNAALRTNLPFFGIACVTLLAGFFALLLWRLRSRDRLLLWVGVFSILYATRLFIQNELVRDAFNAPGHEYLRWAACAAIDTEGHSITYSGAGHPPALQLRREKGNMLQLAENGLFIGPFPNATNSNLSVPIQSGDALLLYTDGIVEASTSDRGEFGRERLEQLLLNSADQQPAEFIDSLFSGDLIIRSAGRLDCGFCALRVVKLLQTYNALTATRASGRCETRTRFRNGRPNCGNETSIVSPSTSATPSPKLNASAPKK